MSILRTAVWTSLIVLFFTPFLYAQQADTGFLVIAPDRGFMGNEEVRNLHQSFAEDYNSSLAFITPEETERFLKEGIDALYKKGSENLVVLPLFVSDQHPMYKLAEEHLLNGKLTDLPVEFSEVMSNSYLIAEILHDRIAELTQNAGEESLVLVATGASGDDEKHGIQKDIEHLLHLNHGRFGFNSESVVVFGDTGGRSESAQNELGKTLAEIRENGYTPVVIPFDLTQKLDGMMAFSNRIQSVVNEHDALYSGKDITPHENVQLWLAKQANGYLPVTRENLGVVFMPHGSNYNWNRTMMDAISELHEDYMIEHAFSMGDATLMNQAVEKLEARGATAVTVLRIFSLESSFQESIEYTLGLRDQVAHGGMMHAMGGPPQRVISSSEFYTTGGLEDSPLFAEALLERAINLSSNPEDETVILVGHGTRTEEGNTRWMNNLKSITAHMEKTAEEQGYNFRDFKFENWREDWPDLRDERIESVRRMVQIASEDGGTAIVIPARTTKGGHAQRWLSDLDFKHDGEGFAPHPLFVEWVEGLIRESMDYFNNGKENPSSYTEQSGAGERQHTH